MYPSVFSHRWLPLAQLVNVPDVSMVMATVAAALMDDDRKQLIGEVGVLSISLHKRNTCVLALSNGNKQKKKKVLLNAPKKY